MPLFPFLIGTVRTGIGGSDAAAAIGLFPFLIGTVRTMPKTVKIERISPFPFLIGTVRTLPDSVKNAVSNSFHSS